jgi:hypothetical protein
MMADGTGPEDDVPQDLVDGHGFPWFVAVCGLAEIAAQPCTNRPTDVDSACSGEVLFN